MRKARYKKCPRCGWPEAVLHTRQEIETSVRRENRKNLGHDIADPRPDVQIILLEQIRNLLASVATKTGEKE